MRAWQRSHRASVVEFKRLAAIEILFSKDNRVRLPFRDCGYPKELGCVPGKGVIGRVLTSGGYRNFYLDRIIGYVYPSVSVVTIKL